MKPKIGQKAKQFFRPTNLKRGQISKIWPKKGQSGNPEPGVSNRRCAPLTIRDSAVARVSEAPPEISRGAPHTLLAYYYELQ